MQLFIFGRCECVLLASSECLIAFDYSDSIFLANLGL